MNLLHQADELARMVCKTAREYESHSEIVTLAHKANHWLDCYHRQSSALYALAPEMAQLLAEWIEDGECFCVSEGVAYRGLCTHCKTRSLLARLPFVQKEEK